MKRKILLGLFAGLMLVSTGLLAAGDSIEVTGEILDLACYISNESHGADHADCAKRCVEAGQPMGVMAEDGTVYVLFADHGDSSAFAKAKKHAGDTVTVSGTMSDRAGVKGITVTAVSSD